MPDLVGKTLGRYQLVERLGRGGMADVYKAYQPGLDRYVAVKVLHPHLAEQPDFVSRFKREAQSVSTLHHPNIVQVFDFDIQGEDYFMAMTYIEGGRTLKEVLGDFARNEQRMPVGQALDLTAKVADALGYAHQQGMIHRDVKPANILIQRLDQPILSDFGIAHLVDATTLTRSGAVVGTPAYMSPEQGTGGKITERSDIYALGVTLYEMLTGRPPYDADTPYGVILKHIGDPLVPPHLIVSLPLIVEPVVLKALAKQPEYRFASAQEMAEALREVSEAIQGEEGMLPAFTGVLAAPQDMAADRSNGRNAVAVKPAESSDTHLTRTPVLAAAATVAAKRGAGKSSPRGMLALAAVAVIAVGAVLAWYLLLGGGRAAIPAAPPGTIFAADIEGTVELTIPGQPVRQLKTGDTVAVGLGGPGIVLRVPGGGRAVVSLDDGSVLYLGDTTGVGLDHLVDLSHGSTGTLLSLEMGSLLAKVADVQGTTFTVETPVGTRADVSGSLLGARYAPELEQFDVDCLEGHCRQFGGPGIPPLQMTACQHSLVVSIGAPEGPDQASSGQWRSLFGDVVPDCSTLTLSPSSAGPTATRVPLVPTFTPISIGTSEVGGSPSSTELPAASAAATQIPPTNTPMLPPNTLVAATSTLAVVPNTLIPATSVLNVITDTPVPSVSTVVPEATSIPSVDTQPLSPSSLPPLKPPKDPQLPQLP